MNAKRLVLVTVVLILIISQPLLLTVLGKEAENEGSKNYLYDYPRYQLTNDNQPKFFLDMAVYHNPIDGKDYAVFTYLIPNNDTIVDQLSKKQYEEDKRPSNSIPTIESRSDFGMFSELTSFTFEMVIASDLLEGGTVDITMQVASNVLGFRNPVIVDDDGYVHLTYLSPVYYNATNEERAFNPGKKLNNHTIRSVLIYQRYSLEELLKGNTTPKNNITITTYEKESVTSDALSYNPKGKNIILTWSSYMQYTKITQAVGADIFDFNFFVNSYMVFNNSILDNLAPNQLPAVRYLFGQNQTSVIPYSFNYRSAYQAIAYIDPSNTTHLLWSWRSVQGVRNNIYHITLSSITPDPKYNFTLTLGEQFEVPVTINDATAILRRINGFQWQDNNYISYVSTTYALPYYSPLNVKYPYSKEFPGSLKKDQVSLDVARKTNEAWVFWSIQIETSEQDQPWFYMVMVTIFGTDGTVKQSRITLTEEVVHIYPNGEFTQDGHLVLGWIQAYNQKTPEDPHWIYDLYLVYKPEPPPEQADPVILLILGILLMTGISAGAIFAIQKFVPKEEKRTEIPMPVE